MSSSETAAIELRDRVAFDVLLQFAQKRESIPWMQFIANVYSSTDFVLPTTCRIAVTGPSCQFARKRLRTMPQSDDHRCKGNRWRVVFVSEGDYVSW